MNLVSTLKTLPLIATMVIGLALTPITAIAEKGGHSYSNKHKSHNSSHRSSQHKKHVLNKRHNSHKYKHHNRRHSKQHNKHVYRNHYARGHRHGHHPRHYYPRNHYYVNTYRDYDVFDNIEFMFGLHTGNFDIIFRD